jgi:hypothetical protein
MPKYKLFNVNVLRNIALLNNDICKKVAIRIRGVMAKPSKSGLTRPWWHDLFSIVQRGMGDIASPCRA